MTMSDGTAGQITPEEALELSRSGAAILLDVREEDEWTAGRAPGAVWLPLGDLRAGAQLPAGLPEQVLCLCRSGNRSQRAADLLAERGVRVLNVAGGMKAWAQAGLPVQDADGETGRIV